MTAGPAGPPPRPWRALRDGALVGVVAPAGPVDAERLAPVEPLFTRFGLRARLYPGCFARGAYLAGPDEMRLADLHAAFSDPHVDAVFCLRGGYGSARLLDRIDVNLLRTHDKPFLGYSDITALHALRCNVGLAGLHAPMPASDLVLPGHEADAKALFDLLRGGWRAGAVMTPVLAPAIAAAIAPVIAPAMAAGGVMLPGVAEGRLIGGNLSLVASLLGTRFAFPVAGSILFLEDVNEEPYRVDRLLAQLRLAGVLDAVRGFVIGSFSQENVALPLSLIPLGDGRHRPALGLVDQASPRAVLDEYLLPLGKPILGGWPAGHCTPNLALPIGAQVRIDAGRGTLTLLQDLLLA